MGNNTIPTLVDALAVISNPPRAVLMTTHHDNRISAAYDNKWQLMASAISHRRAHHNMGVVVIARQHTYCGVDALFSSRF